MRRRLLSAAVLVGLMVPSLSAAQDAPAGEEPVVIEQLGLSDVEIRPKSRERYGRLVYGTLPDGSRVEIDLDRHGNVEEIEAQGGSGFAASAVAGLVPAGVSANPSWPADATLQKLEFEDDGGIEIEGRLADGRRFDAEFSGDGRLIDFDADD